MTTPDPRPGDGLRDQSLEKFLTDRGLKWTFEAEYPIGLIKLGPNVRKGGITAAWVDEVVHALARDERIPPVVVHDDGEAGDGRHRITGHKLFGKETIPAYVVLTDLSPMERIHLGTILNQRNGHRQEQDELLELAMAEVEQGTPRRSVAADLGLPPKLIDDALATKRLERRVNILRPSRWRDVPAPALKRLGNIRSDPVFKAAVELTAVTGRSHSDVSNLVTRVNSFGSEAEQLAEIARTDETWKRSRLIPGSPKQQRDAASHFLTVANTLKGFSPTSVVTCCVTTERLELVRNAARECLKVCESLING